MCSFTFSLSRNRWYFHHEGGSQFGGGSETIGYASASWDRPPVFGGFPATNILASEDRPLPAINFFISDDGGASNVLLSVQASNPLLLPPSNVLLSNAASARSLILAPLPNQFGTSIVTVTAIDSIGNVTNRSFTFVVTPVNDAPAFLGGLNQSLLEDAGPQSVPAWATAITAGPANEASQSVTFEVSNNNPALFTMAPSVSSDGRLSYASAPNAGGTAEYRFDWSMTVAQRMAGRMRARCRRSRSRSQASTIHRSSPKAPTTWGRKTPARSLPRAGR
jgi:hypothetical protein